MKSSIHGGQGGQDRMNSPERDEQILKWMLRQVYRAEQRKKWLDERLETINARRNFPIMGQSYEAVGKGGGVSDGAAEIPLKAAEIESRIYAQKAEIDASIILVMDILDYLPIGSLERIICEMRYIDMMKWRAISEKIPMTRSACNKYYKKAIQMLLQNSKVVEMINSHRNEYEEYFFQVGDH